MRHPLRLFEGFGVEIEYMVVDATTLDVKPVVDELLKGYAGRWEPEVELGALALSNELVLHVAELKTNGPAPSLAGLARLFQDRIAELNERLADLDARLMPTGMHPWMDPHAEMRLWPHEHNAVYEAFHRIFDCRGHGWANLQSVHLNLPFSGVEEFGRLHGAIRVVLPLIPALAASSPILDGAPGPDLDNRLRVYQGNAREVPSVSGLIIPEPVFTRRDYEREILHRIYRDLEPHDPQGILRYEWVNARGAIARFDRSAIEIRLIDAQEHPAADLAVVAAIAAVVRALALDDPPPASMAPPPTESLAEALDRTIRDGEAAVLDDPDYLRLLGLAAHRATAGDIWRHLVDAHVREMPGVEEWLEPLELILERGPLARRILAAVERGWRIGGPPAPGSAPGGSAAGGSGVGGFAAPGPGETGADWIRRPGALDAERLRDVYRRLCEGLGAGRGFA